MAELAALAALASTAAPYVTLGATALGAAGLIQESRAEDAATEANVNQLKSRRTAELADASMKAEQRRKAADALISKQRAIAAASGGGTGGSAATIMGETAAQGTYDSALEMWMGGEKAAGTDYAAYIAKTENKAKKRVLPFKVGEAVLSGVSKAGAQFPGAKPSSSAYTFG
jgi:hypothetical protein